MICVGGSPSTTSAFQTRKSTSATNVYVIFDVMLKFRRADLHVQSCTLGVRTLAYSGQGRGADSIPKRYYSTWSAHAVQGTVRVCTLAGHIHVQAGVKSGLQLTRPCKSSQYQHAPPPPPPHTHQRHTHTRTHAPTPKNTTPYATHTHIFTYNASLTSSAGSSAVSSISARLRFLGLLVSNSAKD